MYNKIVDMVAVTSRTKPLSGGKCERWWRENSTGRHGLDKKMSNRIVSGRAIDPGVMSPSVEETLTRFKFKGFEFGNWLSQAERYDVFRTFQLCLVDMENWLGSTNLGLDHQIAVAFGARGSKGAFAHYEPVVNVINMTKKKGAGSLLHEYAHAIDYTIGGFVPEEQNKLFTALSGGSTITQFANNVGCQFRAMMNKILIYVRSTESFAKLKKKTHYSDYWCNSTELFARLTEAYYAYYYNKNHNYYLVKPVSVYEEKSKYAGVYLSKAEMDVIKTELDKFWKEVGLLLNDKCKLKATPYPKDTTVKKKVKKTKLYFPVTDEYTDGTYREIKRKGGLPKPGTEAWQPLERWLEHYDSLEGKRRGLGIYKSYKIISRTKYSIRYRNNKGEYIESYIVGEDGKRLKEPAPKKKVAEPKEPITLEVSKYSIEYRVYTDKTFKKVKKVERSKVIFENKPLDTLLEHLNRIEKDTKANIVDKRKNTFISRTQYSIRYLTFQGEYYEEVIVDSNGNRLKEKKAPVPKKKDKKQKPIQF